MNLPREHFNTYEFQVIDNSKGKEDLWDEVFNNTTYPHVYYSPNRFQLVSKIYNLKITKVVFLKKGVPEFGIALANRKRKFFTAKNLSSFPHISYAGLVGNLQDFAMKINYLFVICEVLNLDSIAIKQLVDAGKTEGDVVRTIDTSDSFEVYWNSLSPSVRRNVRRVQKEDIQISIDSRHLRVFHKLLCRTLKEKGTPSHGLKYWNDLLLSDSKSVLFTFWDQQELLGGGLLTQNGDFAELECAAFTLNGRKLQVGLLFYYTFIKFAFENNIKSLSLGRSEFGSSVDEFKSRWASNFLNIKYYSLTKPNFILENNQIYYRSSIYKFAARMVAHTPMPKYFVYHYLPLLRHLLG